MEVAEGGQTLEEASDEEVEGEALSEQTAVLDTRGREEVECDGGWGGLVEGGIEAKNLRLSEYSRGGLLPDEGLLPVRVAGVDGE